MSDERQWPALLPPYPAYNDSGEPWLGPVPEHWGLLRLRHAVDLLVSNVDKHSMDAEQPVRLCNYVDVFRKDVIRSDMPFMKATASPDEVDRFRLRVGDVVITKDSEDWHEIGVAALVVSDAPDLVCGYHLAILRPRQGVQSRFLHRCLQSRALAGQFSIRANGVTRFGLSHSAINEVVLPIPSLPEQSAIVRYLDHIDRRIHRYIRAKQRLVALLNEQKQAIIQQAVTRGLDPNVRLKPSGVEWLGEVPEGWEGLSLKRWLSTKITDGPHETPQLLDDGIDFLSAEAIVDGRFDFEHRRGFISPLLHKQYCEKCKPRLDDIFMCKSGATTGKVAIVETDREFSVWSPLALIRADVNRVDPRFLYVVLQAEYVQTQVRQGWSAGTQPNLSMPDMARIWVVMPPKHEQRTILSHIRRRLEDVDMAIARIRQQIQCTREYRTRLIADVVTGKLDVREAAAALPEEVEEAEPLGEVEAPADEETAFDEVEAEADTGD